MDPSALSSADHASWLCSPKETLSPLHMGPEAGSRIGQSAANAEAACGHFPGARTWRLRLPPWAGDEAPPAPPPKLIGIARKPWTSPLLLPPKPTISPEELMPNPWRRYKGDWPAMRLLRSYIAPFCQRNALKYCPLGSIETPVTCPLLLIATAALTTSPGSVPRSVITALLPQERVLVHVAGQVRGSDNLILIVDGEASIFQFSSETAEVNRALALPPQQRVARLERQRVPRVIRRARTRGADCLALVVDPEGSTLAIPGEQRKCLYMPCRPNDRAELQDLRRRTGRVRDSVFRITRYLPPTVDCSGLAIAATERVERRHYPVLPDKTEADEMGAETAEVLTIGIRDRGLGRTRNLRDIV